MRSYTELSKFDTLEDRFKYLMIGGSVGAETFGFDRYLNQAFYNSSEWRRVRNEVIVRDLGCNLGIDGYKIEKYAIIHHINPITESQIINRDRIILDPEFLITTDSKMHKAIHYGNEDILRSYILTERMPGDTRLW